MRKKCIFVLTIVLDTKEIVMASTPFKLDGDIYQFEKTMFSEEGQGEMQSLIMKGYHNGLASVSHN
jgi:hypothetical protein